MSGITQVDMTIQDLFRASRMESGLKWDALPARRECEAVPEPVRVTGKGPFLAGSDSEAT